MTETLIAKFEEVHQRFLAAQANFDAAFAKHASDPNQLNWKAKQNALQVLSARSSENGAAGRAIIASLS